MIKGLKFRGISYKCGVTYFQDKQWSRVIKEFETIPNYIQDEVLCEMLGTCYVNLGNIEKGMDLYLSASEIYKQQGEEGKQARLLEKLEKIKKTTIQDEK